MLPRFVRRNRPSRTAREIAMTTMCGEHIPTCGNFSLDSSLRFKYPANHETRHHLSRGRLSDGKMKSRIKILLIEADTPMAMRMTCFLTGAGCKVKVARTGEAGMKLALEMKFDLILLDMDLLPGIKGLDVCGRLKERHFTRHTPLVIVSKHSSLDDQQEGLDAGAADYITKPFDTSDFVQRILACARKGKSAAEIIEDAMT